MAEVRILRARLEFDEDHVTSGYNTHQVHASRGQASLPTDDSQRSGDAKVINRKERRIVLHDFLQMMLVRGGRFREVEGGSTRLLDEHLASHATTSNDNTKTSACSVAPSLRPLPPRQYVEKGVQNALLVTV